MAGLIVDHTDPATATQYAGVTRTKPDEGTRSLSLMVQAQGMSRHVLEDGSLDSTQLGINR